MKKLPEVSNGKEDDAYVKEKRIFPLEKGNDIIFLLSGSVRRTNNTILLSGVLGTTPTSWGRFDFSSQRWMGSACGFVAVACSDPATVAVRRLVSCHFQGYEVCQSV